MKHRFGYLFLALCCALPLFAQPELLEPNPLTKIDKYVTELKTKAQPYERANAAARLGEMKAPEVVPPLIEALTNDKDAYVVRTCAEALSWVGDKRAVPALLNVANTRGKEPGIMDACLHALLVFADPTTRNPVLAIARDKTVNVRARLIALSVLEVLNDPTLGSELLPIIDEGEISLAPRAAMLAGRLGCAETIPGSLKLMERRDKLALFGAIQALGALKATEAVLPLNDAARDDNATIRVAAIDALAAMKRPNNFPAFLVAMLDKDATVRAHAVAGMAACGSDQAVDSLLKALKDANPGVRAVAAEGLGKYPAAYDQVMPLLADANPDTRAAAALALGAIGRQDAVPALLKLLADPDTLVQTAGMVTLARLGGTAVDAVLPLLKDERPLVRARAAETLGRLAAVKAIPNLTTLQSDPDAAVRLWALTALAAMPKGSPAIFAKALTDRDPDVRCAAARLAADHKIPSAVRPLITLLADGTPRERIAAYQALCTLVGDDLGFTTDPWDAWAKRHGL